MRTIALRFAEKIAPPEGTIKAHENMINDNGFVWYGKMGAPISQKVMDDIMANSNPRILLIHSGTSKRYWGYVSAISRELPDDNEFPSYYNSLAKAGNFKTWFKIIKIETAPSNIMAQCVVASSNTPLSNASRHSMSPYFIINAPEEA